MPTSEELRAQLEVTELEEELVAAKNNGDASHELKRRVREARERYRSIFRSPADAVGDGTAEPAAVEASATVKGGN